MVRHKSYTAAANKGKAGEVFLNNMIASSQKRAKAADAARARANKQHERERARANKAREREIIRAEKQRERERIRADKEQERERKRILREQQVFDKYIARAKLNCEKCNIDEICCEEIVEQAMAAGVTVAQMRKEVINGRENYWTNRAVELREEQYLEDLNNLCDNVLLNDDILEKFQEDFMSDILAERPEISEFDSSPVLSKYISESKYQKKLMKKCVKQIDKELVLQRLQEDFMSDILAERPKISEFDSSPVLLKYISESRYEKELMKNCAKQIDKALVLQRLQEDFMSDILAERPEISEFDSSPVLSKYISESSEIRKSVNNRLLSHLSQE